MNINREAEMYAPLVSIRALLFAGIVFTAMPTDAFGEVLIFECKFSDFSFFATIYDDDTPSRIGVAQGVGDKTQSYFDKDTGAWILGRVDGFNQDEPC